MSDLLILLLVSSIVIPVWLSIARFRTIDKNYLPFIFFLWLSIIIDLADSVLSTHSSIIWTNIYYFFESIIILWQFKKWGLFENNKKTIKLLYTCFILFWLVEFGFVLSTIYSNGNYFHHSYFTCFYSLLFTIFSINRITSLSSSTTLALIKHPRFIICSAF